MPFIFLSYSHKDSEYANRLADSLEAKGLEVWIDERIDYGARWPKVIQENLDRCAAFVVVVTPDSFDSEWVQAELTRARRLRKPTFPLLLDGDIWLALEATQHVDVRGAKLPPPGFFTRLAGVLSAGQAQAPVAGSQRERLQGELDELQRRHDNLSSRIRAVDTDLGREPDGERRLMLEERRADLAVSRDRTVARLAEIEALLAKAAEPQPIPPKARQPEPAGEAALPPLRTAVRPTAKAGAETVEPEPKQPAPPVRADTLPSAGQAPAGPLTGDRVTIDTPIRLELVRIPAGVFPMGKGNEQHPVDVPEFYMGKYPITNAQYAAFVQAAGQRVPDHWQEGKVPAGKETHPVMWVSWHDAMAFCRWLAEATGLAFRLSTEAEWEKAASWDAAKGQKRTYPWGNEFDKNRCNTIESGIGDTTSVGKYSPAGDSPYGAADMSGNVWEWCSSRHRRYPYNAGDGREDLTGEGGRVLRGGSWYYVLDVAAAASRPFGAHPDSRYGYFGFRVCCGVASAIALSPGL